MSYSDPALAMQKGTLSLMKAGATGEQTGGRIYDGVPGGAVKPYVSFGPFQMLPEHGDCLDGGEAFLTLDGWAAGPDTVQVKKLGAAIAADLDRAALVVDGQRLIELSIEQIQYMRDPDGITAHAVVTVHAWTEPVGSVQPPTGKLIAKEAADAATVTGVTVPITATAPVNMFPPIIDDTTPEVDQTLTASPGTWTGTPTLYAYQWVRGVPPVLPVNTLAPAITPTSGAVTDVLTTTNGTWTGTPTPTFTRQWKRNGATNVGTGAPTYTLVAGDETTNITCVVTAQNTAGSVNATSNIVGPIGPAPTGDADMLAWVAAVGPANVSPGRKTAVDTFITALKAAGVWAKLDCYWLLAGENTQSAVIDLKARAAATVTGTPTFTANRGYVTTIGNNFNTNFNPTTAPSPKYLLNDATFGGFINTSRGAVTGVREYGIFNGTDSAALNANFSTYAVARINQSAAEFGNPVTTTRAHWIVTRTSPTAVAMYCNGSSSTGGGIATTATSSVIPNASFSIGAENWSGTIANHSSDQISSFFAGGGLNPTEALALYNAEQTLLTSVGVLP